MDIEKELFSIKASLEKIKETLDNDNSKSLDNIGMYLLHSIKTLSVEIRESTIHNDCKWYSTKIVAEKWKISQARVSQINVSYRLKKSEKRKIGKC